MEPLTARQTQILDFVRHEQDRRGVGPSLQEIQARFGFRSATAAVHHLEALERKGALRRLAGKARAIVLAGERPAFERIPVYGRIPAGYGDAAEPVAEGAVAVDLSTLGVERGSLAKNPRLFALRVRGDSMTGAHIVEGDVVILEFRPAKPDDVVAALIDGETTLKRLVQRKGKTFLKAENAAYPDLIPAQELVIQGVMVGLIRGSVGRT